MGVPSVSGVPGKPRVRLLAGLALGLAVRAGVPLCAGASWPAGSWHWRNPLPQGNYLWDVACADGRFVAVGEGGALLTSTNGATWRDASAGVRVALRGIAYGAGRFVVVGDGGTVLSSTDGVRWASERSGVDYDLRGVAASDSGLFVAVGRGGAILSSRDSSSWTDHRWVTGADLTGVAWGGGLFVAVGVAGKVLSSSDGAQWRLRDAGVPTFVDLESVCYGGGRFVAVGWDDTIVTSADGKVWSQNGTGEFRVFFGVTHSGSRYVAIGGSGEVAISSDGVLWAGSSSGAYHTLEAVAFGAGTFVAVGAAGLILRSADGVDWTPATTGLLFSEGDTIQAVAYGAGTFVAVGNGGAIRVSTDGRQWERRDRGLAPDLLGVEYTGDRFIAAGNGGALLASADGREWRPLDAGVADRRLRGVARSPGAFVVVGSRGTVLRSSDGLAWGIARQSDVEELEGVAYGASCFVAVGEPRVLLRSTDGTVWERRDSPVSLRDVEWGNGVFVAVGDAGVVLASTDGLTWWPAGGPETASLHAVAYGAGHFIAAGANGRTLVSTRGIRWASVEAAASGTLSGVAFGAGTFVAVGTQGEILQSDAVTPPPVLQHILRVTIAGDGSGTVTSAPAGIVCTNDALALFDAGERVWLRADPGPDSSLVGWSRPAGTDGWCVVTADRDDWIVALFQRSADADSDGLPDGWERFHFGGLGSDGSGDADGDGLTDFGEYVAGSLPQDPAHALGFLEFRVRAPLGDVVLRWDTVLGRRYVLEAAADVSAGWVDVFAAHGDGAPVEWSLAQSPFRFFRLRAELPLVARTAAPGSPVPRAWGPRVPGFQRVTALAGRWSAFGLNVVPSGAGTVDGVFAGQLSGARTPAASDQIVKFDAAAQRHEPFWRLDSPGHPLSGRVLSRVSGRPATNETLTAGDAVWILNRTDADETILVVGTAVGVRTVDRTVWSGFNLVAYPFSGSRALNGTSLARDGAGGAGKPAEADQVFFWDAAAQRYDQHWLFETGTGHALDGSWIDRRTGRPSAARFGLGTAAWYLRRGSEPFLWSEDAPYSFTE